MRRDRCIEGEGTRIPGYIVDAPSGRIVVGTGDEPEATEADLAELDAIIASMVIE
jgi:hypothetical protein